MPSPFPGVDPFIEAQGHWDDFHRRLMGSIGDWLAETLPDDYVARYEKEAHRVGGTDEESRDLWIEIISLPARELVTVIEVLWPTNKGSSGREKYLAKRRAVLEQPVHLVEIDLSLGGGRVPMRRPLPPGEFYTFVARSERRPDCEVHAWSIRDRLPTIPIPLKAPDTNLPLNLAPLFDRSYDRGRYARLLRYDVALPAVATQEDRSWAEGVAQRME